MVNFTAGLSELDIHDFLTRNGMRGTFVSSFRNRFAVDIPNGTEDKCERIVKESTLVEKVYPRVPEVVEKKNEQRKATNNYKRR